jgi:ABC-type Fe3+-hydroxamate transport system substrate-binding protein
VKAGAVRCRDSTEFSHNDENVAGVHSLMKSLCFAAVLVVLTAGCSSTSSPASYQTAGDSNAYMLHTPDGLPPADSASRPPRLTVGTSYSDTQLILPWFLNDVINFVNYR